ncbi:MAG: NAD(+) synthase [Candidatus Doudnabacteria bacterium]|nr:NAD(+) synthase [Candidatus Doudnabacteria bacterium]
MSEIFSLEGFKIGLCQQPCRPADPAYNAEYFIEEIERAENDEVDLLVGVEGMQGYLIGDQYEYPAFLHEVDFANQRIRQATFGKKVVVAYGSVLTQWNTAGEDGRVARVNGGVILADAGLLKVTNFKTLSPNYRMFAESRYFLDNRKLSEKWQTPIPEMLQPLEVEIRDGRLIRVGQEFCEDMWHQDYAISPTELLARNGADIIINHSASPWTWRKNNKRHRVIKELLGGIPKEFRPKLFVYVNRTGVEQSNKNFYIYDGSSAVYDGDGDLIYEVLPYQTGTKIFVCQKDNPKIEGYTPDDTEALYNAMGAVIDNFFGRVQCDIHVGLSGGIDSSVVAALLVSRLGPHRVIGVNMPYGDYNSPEGKSDASALAANLGIEYRTMDITHMVNGIAIGTGVASGTLAHQNIQARCRMEVLAALSQNGATAEKIGFFTANGNKVEMTFGYGTMYGDVAGAIMLLSDLVKREIYQMGDYLNRVVYKREVIPAGIFTRKPTAELDTTRSADPYDYGDLARRGYHDEWVRAVTEFRWDPVRFLTEYEQGTLEQTMLLPSGHIAKLFPSAESFVKRLEKDWSSFTASYWKRMQCPPGPIFTRRAYGGDLSESIYAFPPTNHYREIRRRILSKALAQTS